MRPATIVGWTGYGRLADLRRAVGVKLSGKTELLEGGPDFLVARGGDPIAAARALAHLPGVSWVAVGYEFADFEGCMESVSDLAKKYLSKGATFAVSARVEGGARTDGDVVLEANSRILYAAKGATISEKSPAVRFRVVMHGDGGACGVQLMEGVGGVPTTKELRAYCLVSGGYHSSAMSWLAVLSGFSVTLVHARGSDEELRQVSRLYSELSYRADPTGLELHVLEGKGGAGERLIAWLEQNSGTVLAGSHPECRGRGALKQWKGKAVLEPLLLSQERDVKSILRDLGLKEKREDAVATLRVGSRAAAYSTRKYGGRTADLNHVLDNILSKE